MINILSSFTWGALVLLAAACWCHRRRISGCNEAVKADSRGVAVNA
ncbi:putative membrane protein [Propionispora sp. 2/2-37]|nr:hypothetical protein [Propionispora sp. 2/2-37]CUH96845.1 putative membrane protein [Propionispora sp. 2/2-37]